MACTPTSPVTGGRPRTDFSTAAATVLIDQPPCRALALTCEAQVRDALGERDAALHALQTALTITEVRRNAVPFLGWSRQGTSIARPARPAADLSPEPWLDELLAATDGQPGIVAVLAPWTPTVRERAVATDPAFLPALTPRERAVLHELAPGRDLRRHRGQPVRLGEHRQDARLQPLRQARRLPAQRGSCGGAQPQSAVSLNEVSPVPRHAPEAHVRGGVADAVALPGRRAVALAVVRRAQVGPALGDHPVGLPSAGPRSPPQQGLGAPAAAACRPARRGAAVHGVGSTPRRCRSCRRGRSRWAGRCRPARSGGGRPGPRCATGTGPARCWPARRPAGAARRPRRSPRRPARRGRRAPTRPRSAGPCRPRRRTPRRPPSRRARPGGPGSSSRSCPVRRGAPLGARLPAPPLRPVAEVHRARRLGEHLGAGHQQRRVGAREVGGVERVLGDGDVAGLLDEARRTRRS